MNERKKEDKIILKSNKSNKKPNGFTDLKCFWQKKLSEKREKKTKKQTTVKNERIHRTVELKTRHKKSRTKQDSRKREKVLKQSWEKRKREKENGSGH